MLAPGLSYAMLCMPRYFTESNVEKKSNHPVLKNFHLHRRVALAKEGTRENGCGISVSVHDPFRAGSLLAARSRARIELALRHVLHETNVIVLRQVSVFLQIGTLVLGHGGKKVFEQLVRDQRMPQVEFGNVGL